MSQLPAKVTFERQRQEIKPVDKLVSKSFKAYEIQAQREQNTSTGNKKKKFFRSEGSLKKEKWLQNYSKYNWRQNFTFDLIQR